MLELPPSSCLSKWAGEAERRLRDTFTEARRRSPCIVFLDELDALTMNRDIMDDTGARRVLSELLIQMSAVHPEDRVVVIAATNRIRDIDPAILRRFQKTIEVPLPTLEEREQIILANFNGITHTLTSDEIHSLSEATVDWSGSLLNVSQFDAITSRIYAEKQQ